MRWQADSYPLSYQGSPFVPSLIRETLLVKLLSRIRLFATPWTVAYQVPPSMGFSRQWHPTPVFLLGKSHGRRNLVGYSPWGRKESDTTE